MSSSDISSPEVTGPWGPVATLEICALEGEEGSAKSARGDEGRRRRAFFSSALEKKSRCVFTRHVTETKGARRSSAGSARYPVWILRATASIAPAGTRGGARRRRARVIRAPPGSARTRGRAVPLPERRRAGSAPRARRAARRLESFRSLPVPSFSETDRTPSGKNISVEAGFGASRSGAETYREITLDGADRRARGESLRIERGDEAGSARGARKGKPRVGNCPVGEENNRATPERIGGVRVRAARVARSPSLGHRSPVDGARGGRASRPDRRACEPRRARESSRGNDDVDARVLSLGREGISRTRTFFATTLVFLAAARLAETPRVVKAPARAEAEAIVVVCGCCDAGARGKYDRRTARARRSFPLTRSSWPSSLPSGKEISRAIWEGHLTGEESGISRKRIFDLPSAESVEIDEI